MSRLSVAVGITAAVVALQGVAAPTVDLTALARAAKAITASASSVPSSGYKADKAFDGDCTSSSTDAWHSDPNGGTNQWLACQFKDTFESGRYIMVLSYSIYYNSAWCGAGNGFTFADYNANDMLYVIRQAVDLYINNPAAFKVLRKTGMTEDFSWDRSAEAYTDIYRSIRG